MIRRTDITPADVLRTMQTGAHTTPERLDGLASDADRAAADAAMKTVAQDPSHVRTLCAGCGTDVALLDSAMCACGGFVCQDCQRVETDGVCTHERPDWLPAEDEDDED